MLLLKRRIRSHDCSLVVMDPRWKHPFTCIVAGPTGCGKTTFVARLLRNASVMIDPPPEQVTWYYGQWQSAYEYLDIPKLRLEEGLPMSFDTGKRNVRRSHGRNRRTRDGTIHEEESSLEHIRHIPRAEPFPETQGESNHTLECTIFKNPRDASQVTHLAKQMYPGRVNFVQEAFNDATNVPYGYLLVDLKQDTPEDLRLRTTIIPDDAVQYVYVPKL